MDEGGELASLLPRTLGVLDKALPRAWSHGNPVDIVGDADGARYATALDALADDRGVGAVLAMNVPTALTSSVEAARAVAGARRRQGRAGDRLLDRRAGGTGRPPCAARGRHPGLRHAAARGARLHAHRAIPPRPACAPAHAAVGAAGALRHPARARDRGGRAEAEARRPHRARIQTRAGGLRHSRGADRGRARWRRGRGSGACASAFRWR